MIVRDSTPSLYRSLPYDTRRDLVPVSLINLVADVLVVNPEVPATSVRELIDLARRQPRGLIYASAGNGTLNHLAPELLKSMAGVDMVHVPYKGALAALNDVVAGRGQVYIGALASAVPQVKAGKLRALAVTGARRSAVLPDLPTMAEAGVPGYDVNAWYGLLAPGGTPAGVVDRIQRDVARIGREPAFERMLAADGNEPVLGTPAEFATFLDREIGKWRRAVLDAGAVVD
ncbi:tripartite tricarboxylate transporter substrate-binding protein [Pigmentiphaga daeguensis]